MGGEIMALLPTVVIRPQQGASPVKRRADRNLALRGCDFRFPDSSIHPFPICFVHSDPYLRTSLYPPVRKSQFSSISFRKKYAGDSAGALCTTVFYL